MSKEPAILIESSSPITPVQAFVEDNGNNIYFYLWIHPESKNPQFKPCWICNKKKAPITADTKSMDKGMAPMLEAEYCKNPKKGETLDADKLNIVWFPDGDGAALLEEDKIICCIPSWANEGFYGYSRFCKGTSNLAWEMNEDCENNLIQRVEDAKKFWEFFDDDIFDSETWPTYQKNMLSKLDNFFDERTNYFAIDGGKFPPKALVIGTLDGNIYGCTIAASLFPMPKVEMYHQEETSRFSRIEIAFACKKDSMDEQTYKKYLNYIAMLGNLPWYELSWLGHGHTIDCNAIDGFPQAMLVNSSILTDIPSPKFDDIMGSPVNVLWVVPMTEKEFAFSSKNTSLELLEKYQGDMKDLIVFDGQPKFIK